MRGSGVFPAAIVMLALLLWQATGQAGDKKAWEPGDPTPQEVIDILGFDPATVPDAPPEPTPDQQAILKQAKTAYDAKDYKKAHDLWLPLAEAGVAEAEFQVGRLYSRGEGVNIDAKTYMLWYSRAISHGHPKAKHNLGNAFFQGKGVSQDYRVAASLYKSASSASVLQSRTNLGLMYMGGRGVPRDFIKGYMWFYLAGDDGFDARQYFMTFTSDEQRKAGRRAADLYKP